MEKHDISWRQWIKQKPTGFCPGCLYGIILNCLACALEELKINPSKVIVVSGIGCAGRITDQYLKTDTLYVTHGRPIAYATGIKLANPGLNVLVVSGDGDLATIGGNHLIHSARRNHINLSVFCVNNFLYGMTGGQAGATTPCGAITSTSPQGNPEKPFDLIRLVMGAGCKCASRYPVILGRPYAMKNTNDVIEAIKTTIQHLAFSFMEFISPCVTHFCPKNRLKTPKEQLEYLKNLLIPKEKAMNFSPEEKKDKLVYGTFTDLSEYLKLAGNQK